MARQITGILKNPDGSAMASTQVTLTAFNVTPPSIPTRSFYNFTTDGTGAYDETIENGQYRVTLLIGTRAVYLGNATVTTDAAIDLLTLISITDGLVAATDIVLAVSDGGTGANNAAQARTNLGLSIGADVQGWSAVLDATTASFTLADQSKLDNIEYEATADQTASEIRVLVDSAIDSNVFTDSEKGKVGYLSVTQPVDLDTLESDTAANNAKVSNVTTNLSVTTTATTNTVVSSDGTDAILSSATPSLAGLSSASDKSKLDNIEYEAEVNNISDVDAADLTDSGQSALHYHDSDRSRSNHTGTQTASTISDFTEAAQDAAGAMAGSSPTISLTYDDPSNQLTADLSAVSGGTF